MMRIFYILALSLRQLSQTNSASRGQIDTNLIQSVGMLFRCIYITLGNPIPTAEATLVSRQNHTVASLRRNRQPIAIKGLRRIKI